MDVPMSMRSDSRCTNCWPGGRHLMPKDRPALFRQLTQKSRGSLRQIDSTIPRDLETIVRCFDREDPDHRYATAAILRDEQCAFWPVGRSARGRSRMPEQYWRWCKRTRHRRWQARAASRVADRHRGRLEPGCRLGTAGSPEPLKSQRDAANRNLIQAYTNQADARRHTRRVGHRFEALDAVARAMKLAPDSRT